MWRPGAAEPRTLTAADTLDGGTVVPGFSDSAHARLRMAQRGLSEADVEAIVAHPLRVRRSRATGETLYYGRVYGMTVLVVVARGSVPPRVITVWTR